MTHHGADVAPIHSHRYQLSMPADRIERIVREGDRRQPTPPFHYYARDSVALLRTERVVHARRVEDRGVEDSLRPEDTFLWQLIGALGGFNQQHGGRRGRFDAPHRSARERYVVAVAVRQASPVAEQFASTVVDEQQFVAI